MIKRWLLARLLHLWWVALELVRLSVVYLWALWLLDGDKRTAFIGTVIYAVVGLAVELRKIEAARAASAAHGGGE